jgi:thymidylate kinase
MAEREPATELARDVATTVDVAATARVLVLGSLPPHGRDLDLLAHPDQRDQIGRALRDAGLAERQSEFALFRGCSAFGVELLSAERFLAGEPLRDLFAEAIPLDGFATLARPAPVHALLILARLVTEEGILRAKRRARLERILAEEPRAWEPAREAAVSWCAERALARLERMAGTATKHGSPGGALRVHRNRLRRPRRGLLVALSGVDGAGKSSQALWLADAMTALGADVEVVWNDLLGNRATKLLAALPKAALRLTGRGRARERMARWDDSPPRSRSDGSAGRARLAWSLIVTLANALEQQAAAVPSAARGRVVVFDRSPLDLAVRMQVLYRANVELQRRLIALAAPRPDLAFLLDIPAEVSLARKNDVWSPRQLGEQTELYRELASRFGAARLDGTRAAEEIAAEIARATWLALGGTGAPALPGTDARSTFASY